MTEVICSFKCKHNDFGKEGKCKLEKIQINTLLNNKDKDNNYPVCVYFKYKK